MEKKNIIGLVLAGGDSTRLWPLEDKYTLDFLGKPLAYHAIEQLVSFGIRTILVIVNQTNLSAFEKLQAEFPDVHFTFLPQTDVRGMAGAVLSAASAIAGKPVLIVNPSDIYEENLLRNFEKILQSDPDGVIAGIAQEQYFPGGYITVSSGNVTRITEKPDPKNLPSNIVSFVFHYFKNASVLLETLEKGKKITDDMYEQAIDQLIDQGFILKFLRYEGFWGFLKFPWDLLNLMSYYLSANTGKIARNVRVAKTATLVGKIQIESGVTVLEGAKIVGPSFIGQGTVIGNNAVIRESHIGARCVVGYNSEIVRSFVGRDCWFHSNYLGDSICADNIGMGAGAILANFKLNETTISTSHLGKKVDTARLKFGAVIGENVRIGIHASIMPGVKIGKNSHIGSAVLLDRDIGENVYCFTKPHAFIEKKLEVKKKIPVKNIQSIHF